MKLYMIIKKIVHEPITLELKNGIVIHGVLQNVDKCLNIFLKNVKRSVKNSNSIFLKGIAIRGNNIRYIILPNWLNLDSLLYEFNEKD